MENSNDLNQEEELTAITQELLTLFPETEGTPRENLESLIPRVYDELKKVASRQLRGDINGHTMHTTVLVNEACLRLMEADHLNIHNRKQFFYFAARIMRRLLVDHVRRRGASKRGSNVNPVPLDEAIGLAEGGSLDLNMLLSLNAALDYLEKRDPRQCRIVELRFFAGMSTEETCEILDISERTLRREWRVAKRWLARELGSGSDQDG